MKRSLVFALMLSLGHASVAMAGRGPRDADFASWGGGETLLQSGKRITQQVTKAPPSRVQPLALQGQTTTLAQTGMRKRTKFLIAMGIAGAFAGVAIAVDRGVEDSTPSSLRQR
jgi:hypothetical protein